MKKIGLGILLAACLFAGRPAAGLDAVSVKGLDDGLYPVGFRLLQETDGSRSFPSTDGTGLRSRPMRIYLWYPAEGSKGAGLKIGDFVRMAADDFRLSSSQAVSKDEETRGLPVPLAKGLDEAQLRTLNETPLRAIREAKQRPGIYPLLVLGQGLYYESPLSFVFLCEYLAGRGYIVATCPLLGTQHRLVNLNVEDLETGIRDLEFVIAAGRTQSGVHPRDLGVIGYDISGMSGLVLAMRNPDVDAYLSLDSAIISPHFSGLPGSHPQFHEDRFTIPWMHMTQDRFLKAYRKDAAGPIHIDRKTYGDSFLVGVPTNSHGWFSSYARFGIRRAVPGYWGPVEDDPRPLHDEICRLAGLFFDAYLKKDSRAAADLRTASDASNPGRSPFPIERKEGAAPPLSSASIVHIIIEKGVVAARPIIDRMRNASPGWKPPDENELNWLGYHFMFWWGREAEAAELFKLVTELYPGSANAYDSLGESYLGLGRTDEAIAAYRKSLELNPKNTNAAEVLERLAKKK